MMVKLFSVKEMVALEKEANASGLSYEEMMENAGRDLAEIINSAYSHINNKKIYALVGPGNNGGDALVALSYLAKRNWDTAAYVVGKREKSDTLIGRLSEQRGSVIYSNDDEQFQKLDELIDISCVMIDGVLGTGTKLPLKGEAAKVLGYVSNKLISELGTIYVVAVDCPSGVDCDTGEAAPEAIPADITVTMAGYKPGLIRFPAAGLIGEIKIASIGDIAETEAYKANNKVILDPNIIKQYLPERPLNSHKGTFGTAFIVAGSVNFTGASLLAGKAAYRVGTGLVMMAVPEPLHTSLSGHFPEATWVILPHEMGVISAASAKVVHENIGRTTALLVGPGFALEETTREFMYRLLNTRGDRKKGKIGFVRDESDGVNSKTIDIPFVVDADGLKLMSKIENWHSLLPNKSVLTPHPGEMSMLTGLSVDEIQANRIDVASQYAMKWGHIIVLKGAFTVIAEPNGSIAIVPVATSALAKAGTGDVLAGLITGFIAQGVGTYEAACSGAWIHAQAGLLAAKSLGNTASVIAGDVLSSVPGILSALYN